MKYRVTQPFIAFGMTPEVGEIVELTSAQAEALREVASVAPYEVKILRPPKEIKKKSKEKQSQSAPAVPRSRKKTAKKSGKTAKK